jgi:hypothetical protein
MTCPWCGRNSLRQLAAKGRVYCIDTGCTDGEGRRPEAFLEFVGGEPWLRWQDGVVQGELVAA